MSNSVSCIGKVKPHWFNLTLLHEVMSFQLKRQPLNCS